MKLAQDERVKAIHAIEARCLTEKLSILEREKKEFQYQLKIHQNDLK